MIDKNIKIKAEVDTEQIEQATEKTRELADETQNLADALNEFPANVMIKNARNCTFNIYPSQTRIISEGIDKEQGKEMEED